MFLFVIGFLLLFCNENYAQSTEINPKVLQVFEKATVLLEANNYDSYAKGTAIIQDLKSKLKKENNKDQLIHLYLELSYYYTSKFDYTSSKKELDAVAQLLKYYDNKVLKGSYYEHMAVYYNAQGNKVLDEKYTLLSQKYIEKYAPIERKLDLYYNLILLYLKKEDWQKALHYSSQFLKTNKAIGESEDQPEIYLFMVECMFHLNQFNEAKIYLKKVAQSETYKNQDPDFLLRSRYYYYLGNIYLKQGDYKNASLNLNIANDYFKKRFLTRISKVNKSFVQKRELELKNIEYQYVIKQQKLQNENTKYKNYLLLLCFFIIIILLVFLYNQLQTTKYKTRTNLLLNEKNELLNISNSELNDALNVKKRLLDTISHELRTPIYTINGILHLMKKDKNNYYSNIKQLVSSTRNLYNLSNNVIEINALENIKNTFVPSKNTIILKKLIEKIVDIIQESRPNNNEFKLIYDAKIPNSVIFDYNKLYHVLFNLIDNAFKFTKDGCVTIEVQLEQNTTDFHSIRFNIIDTGIGIQPEILNSIYNLFFQGSEKINYEFGGSGLGLTLVKKTLDLFQSKIEIQSDGVSGTAFSFILNFEKKIDSIEENTNTITHKTTPASKINILLVEDVKINQLLTQKIIAKKGYNCFVANNGLEALNIVKEKDFQLIFMDIMMPIMDGFEAAEKISILKPTIPIVALTAVSEQVNKELFDLSKIKKVLSKPVDMDELYKTIDCYCN